MASSLLDWVKDKKDKEEKDKAAASKTAQSRSSRAEKDDVYVPKSAPTKAPVQDERKEAVQAKRDDSLSKANMSAPAPARNFIPSSFAPAPSPVQGPPRPSGPSNPVNDAAESWREKPDKPSTIQPYKLITYDEPTIGLSNDRPDTGAPEIQQSQFHPSTIAAPTVQPYQAPKPYDFGQTAQQKPAGFQPWNISALATGEGQQGGGLLGDVGAQAGNYLKSWMPKGIENPAQAIRDYTATTGYGQAFNAQVEKNREGVDANSWGANLWADAKDIGALVGLGGGAVENVPIPGANLKAGQVVQAGLTVPARAVNPFDSSSIWRNPATFNTPGVQESKDALAKLQTPEANQLPLDQQARLQSESSPAAAVGNWLKDTFMGQINKAQAVNKYISSLPAEQQNKVQIAYSIMQSGPEAMQNAVGDILGQQQKAQDLTRQAQEAQAQAANPALSQEQQQQAAMRAAQYGAQANAEKNMSALDYVDKNAHPGAQFVGSLVTDPLNYLPIDKVWHAYKAARTAKVFDVSAEEALKTMPKAMAYAEKILGNADVAQDATRLMDAGAQKTAVLGPTFWEKFRPDKNTPESLAQQATTKVWNAATQLIKDVTSKEDARLLITSWVDNPEKLVQGVTGLTSPGAQTAAVDGVYKVGGGVIANKPLLDVMPVIQQAGDALKNLKSLAGEGAFNPMEFAGEVDNVVYETARKLFGLDPMDALGAAVEGTKPVLARLPDGTGVINYVDKAGKVVSSTTPKVFYNAQQDFKALKTAASNAGGSAVSKAVELPFQVQRALLSDMYLALSPGHWIRNAASATATLLTDGNYGTKNQGEMIGDLTKKFGDIFPERELQNTIAGTGQEIPHIAERYLGKNPYSALVNKANEVWTGLTNVAGVPFGEQSFKLTAKYNSFQRIFRNVWKDAVGGEFAAGLDGLGIAPDVAKTLTNHVVDAGIQGNKQSLAEAARSILSQKTIKVGLRELGIPDELISMEGWGKLADVLRTSLPEQADEAAQAIKQVFTDELTRRGNILNDAPPQLGNHPWMATEAAHDSAAVIDSLRESGKAAGLPVDQVESTVQQFAKNLESSLNGAWEKFRNELPQTADPQAALGVAFDTYAAHSDLKQAARAAVDDLSRKAAQAQTPEAWAQKWQGTQEIYSKLVKDTQELFAGTRARIMGVQTGEAPVYDWWKAIERYANYDEAAVQQARTAGAGLGSTTTDQAAWTASIDAGRQYVDKTMLELYDAWRKNPTQESLDLLVAAQNKIDHMGAQVAAHLKPLRDEAMQTGAWGPYYNERNTAWGQFFDNAAIHNKATERVIVADGVTSQYKQALTWNDPMYGDMRLIAPDTKTVVDNSSKARGIIKETTGQAAPRVHNFDMWQVADESGAITSVPDKYVPDEVKAAWNKVINHSDEVDQLVAPAVRAPAKEPFYVGDYDAAETIRRQGGQTATQIADAKRAASKLPRPLEGNAVQEGIGQAQSSAKDLIQARDTLKTQWDRQVTGHWQLPSMDTLIARYERKGVVNVPENMFEDIYGTTVAGRRINGQADVESLLSEYAQLKSQANAASKAAEAGAATMEDLHAVAQSAGIKTTTGAGNPNDQYLLNAINAERKAQKLKAITLEQLTRDPALRETSVELLMNKIGPSGGPTIHAATPTAERQSWQMTRGEFEKDALYQGGGPANTAGNQGRQTGFVTDRPTAAAGYASKSGEAGQIRVTHKSKWPDPWVIDEAGNPRQVDAATYWRSEGEASTNPSAIRWQETIPPSAAKDPHRYIVEQAIKRGEEVPASTLAEYPDLAGFAQTAAPNQFDPFKLEEGQTVDKVLAENVAKSKTINGNKAPEMGEAFGTHMIDKLKSAEQKILSQLQNILTGQPNTLTEAQRVGAMDLLNQLLPAYDNALAGASQGATDAMNFGMLDPSNRRNADVWLSHLMPFHYFWSRSAKNWAERVLAKPGVLHAYYMAEQNIGIENKQQNLPARLEGTLPNPLNEFGVGPQRIGNPLIFALPFAGYGPNQYVNPEDATSEAEKWWMRVRQFTPGLMPAIQAAGDAALDYVSPQPDGKKRFDKADYAPNKFIPGLDLAGYGVQALTGKTAANMPTLDAPTFGDKFDPYRIGRKAAEIAAGQFDDQTKAQAVAQYTQQYALNISQGKNPLENIPPEYAAIVPGMYTQASKGAAQARLWSKAGSFLTGVPGYEYSPEEKQMAGQQNELYKLGYNEFDNPYGSKTAMSQYRQENPELQSYQSKGALVPGNDKGAPAESAQTTAKIAEEAGIKQQQAKVVELYLKDHNGQATYEEIEKLKAPFKAKLDALDTKYPLAGGGGAAGVPQGMSPEERAKWQENQLVFGAGEKAPVNPGESASAEERLAYYKAKEKYESDRLNKIEGSANSVFAEQGDPPAGGDWQNAFKNLTRGQYAQNIVSDAYLTNVSQAEKDWSYAMTLDNEVAGAGRKANMAAVAAAVGPETAKLYETYNAMVAGSDEKKAFLKSHPELAEANMIAYNKPQYDAMVKTFGPDALAVYNNRPKYPEGTNFDALTDAQKATYNAQMDAYTKAHPELSQIKMWMDGRQRAFTKAPEGQYPVKDYGKDYAEAIKIFGPSIFKVESGYPYNGDGKAKAEYFKAHPELSGFWEWKKELADTPPNYTGATADKSDNQYLDMANWYNGPRPYGSGRQPIGVQPVTQQQGQFLQPGGPWNPQAAPRALNPDAKPEYKAYQSGASTPSYMQPGATIGEAAGAPVSTNTKTAADYAQQSNEAYFKEHGYYPGNSPKYQKWQQSQADYAAKRASVAAQFGDEAAATWEAYGKLPKGSKAREDYKAAHPEMKAYDMAAYNPDEYKAAEKLFGSDAWMEWAKAPKSDGTDEGKAAHAAYMDEHPNAKLLNAWVYGRPSADKQQDTGEGFKYNFGADFSEAQKQFGDDIWNVFAGYKSGFDKGQKAAYMKEHPQLGDFFGWWYGNDKSAGGGAYRSFGKGGYAGRGYGGGGYGGGGGGGGGGHAGIRAPKLENRYMDKNLIITAEDLRRDAEHAWRPHNIDLSWMRAGDRIGPENLRKWKR